MWIDVGDQETIPDRSVVKTIQVCMRACVCVCMRLCVRARACVCVRVCLRTLQKVICNFDICFVISDASQQQKTLLISYTEPLST